MLRFVEMQQVCRQCYRQRQTQAHTDRLRASRWIGDESENGSSDTCGGGGSGGFGTSSGGGNCEGKGGIFRKQTDVHGADEYI